MDNNLPSLSMNHIPTMPATLAIPPENPPAYPPSATFDLPPPVYMPVPRHNEITVEVAWDVPLVPHHAFHHTILGAGDQVITLDDQRNVMYERMLLRDSLDTAESNLLLLSLVVHLYKEKVRVLEAERANDARAGVGASSA
jgi:hypothetical protein